MMRPLIRYSNKAKYLHLRVTAHRGVELIVPKRKTIAKTKIDEFLQAKRSWIEKQAQRVFMKCNVILPQEIQLLAIDKKFRVNYLQMKHKRTRLMMNADDEIAIVGDIEDTTKCCELLKRWIKKLAYPYLFNEVKQCAELGGFVFTEVVVKLMVMRWGSCSANGRIHLAASLLLLRKELMQHVIWHELCHTKIMNHGESFKRLLTKFDANTCEHKKALSSAQFELPRWLLAKCE